MRLYRYAVAFLLLLLGTYAQAQTPAVDRQFGNWMMGRLPAGMPFGSNDIIPIIQGGITHQVFANTAFMQPDGSNLSSALTFRNNLGAVSGIWPGSVGGTGVDNTGRSITLGDNIVTGGPFSTEGSFTTGGAFSTAGPLATTGTGPTTFAFPNALATYTFPTPIAPAATAGLLATDVSNAELPWQLVLPNTAPSTSNVLTANQTTAGLSTTGTMAAQRGITSNAISYKFFTGAGVADYHNALEGAMLVPSTSTVFGANALMAAIQSDSTYPGIGGTNAVAGTFLALCTATEGQCWAGNDVLADAPAQLPTAATGQHLIGREIDMHFYNATTTGAGINIVGDFRNTAWTGLATGYAVTRDTRSAAGNYWTFPFITANGASQNIGMSLGAADTPLVPGLKSQKLRLVYTGGATAAGQALDYQAWGLQGDVGAIAHWNTLGNYPVHFSSSQTVPPTLVTCGANPVISGTDTAGIVTMGTGSPTECSVQFTAFRNSVPACVVSLQTPGITSYISNKGAGLFTVTLSAGTNGAVFNYFCFGVI